MLLITFHYLRRIHYSFFFLFNDNSAGDIFITFTLKVKQILISFFCKQHIKGNIRYIFLVVCRMSIFLPDEQTLKHQ